MRRIIVCPLLTLAFLAINALAEAGVGGSGGGVTTGVGTSGTNSTAPSTDVQSQSAGFVQQNQQMQNAGAVNPLTPGDPAKTATGTPGGDPAAKGADGKPAAGGPAGAGNAAAANAAPAAPHAPPPDYVSVVKRLNRTSTDRVATDGNAPDNRAQPAQASEPLAEEQAPVAPPKPPPGNPLRPNRAAPDTADKRPAEHAPVPPPVTGGSGTAPDGYTFYIGLIVAGVLLAFAATNYLRIGGNESAKS